MRRFFLTAMMTALPLTAQAAEWQARFDAPEGPQEAMRIDLPEHLDLNTLMTLGVELDGVDITAMLSMEGTDFTYTPIEPLAPGAHRVALVVLHADGSMEPQQQWQFTLGGAPEAHASSRRAADDVATDEAQVAEAEAWLRSASFQSDNMMELSHRMMDANLAGGTDRTILSGAGDMRGEAQAGQWTVSSRADYMVQSDHDLALTGETADIGEYHVTADYAGELVTGGVTLGHHDLGLNSYLFSNFYRRGASARLGAANDRVKGSVFAFKPEAVTGVDDMTGLAEDNNRLEGGTFSLKPFSGEAGALQVTTLYYDGEANDAGTGIVGGSGMAAGSGWGVIADKGFANDRVLLRGEYTQADYDADGAAGVFAGDTGSAFALALETRPFEQLSFGGQPADLVTGLRYEKIDTFFRSLANPGLAADRNAWTAYGNFYWNALSMNLQLVDETNNVDDLAGAPEDRLQHLTLNSTYSFNPQEGNLAWLGTPYVNAAVFLATMNREKTPSGYTGFDTDTISRSFTLGGGTSYNRWYWGANHTWAEFDDHANNAGDTLTTITGVYAGWNISDGWDVHGSMQFGSMRDRTQASNAFDTTMNFGVTGMIIPNLLRANFDYNMNLSDGDGDIPDRHIVNSEVEWMLVEPRTNRPGLALALRGAMEDSYGSTTQDGTVYQVFSLFRVKAPLAFSR